MAKGKGMNHTPGPWKQSGLISAGVKGETSIVIDAKGFHIARLFTPNGPFGCNSLAPGFKTTEANGFLIAAAPELLAACQEALTQINLGIHVAWDPGISDHLRAAVAKAGRP